MSFYRECPLCGASLDPGEHCDCRDEREKEVQAMQALVRVGRNGQMKFCFTEEARRYEKAVV